MTLCNAHTEEDYISKLASLRSSVLLQVAKYLEENWLNSHRERFVVSWTKNIRHFGHAVTSRVEGSHAFIKQWIATSTLDLGEVYGKIVPTGDA